MNARSPLANKPRKFRSLIFRLAYYFFLAGGVWGLGYAGYALMDARTYQAVEEAKISDMRPAMGPHAVAAGEVIGEMKIPRLEVRTIVVQGESSKILRRAVGHLPETALPGESGNVVLAGHRDSFFRPLRNIRVGDAITIWTPEGEVEYQVEWTKVVWPTDVQVLQPSSENTLTLVTCFPFYYLGSAPKRFIVHARQVGQLPAPSALAQTPQRL